MKKGLESNKLVINKVGIWPGYYLHSSLDHLDNEEVDFYADLALNCKGLTYN
jgi:hypothetical protein